VMVTAVLFGLAPAVQLRGEDLRGALTSAATRMTASFRDRRLLNGLVVFEIALAVILLVGGGLLVRAYGELRRVDPGFRPDGVLLFRVSLPSATYKNGDAQMAFYGRLIDRVRAMPGVDHAALITCPPFSCHWGNFYKAEGAPPLARNEADPVTLTRYASPDYFAAMGLRFAFGRPYAENEGSALGGYRPVVINEELAHRLWPGLANPTGKRLESRGDTSSNWSTVVGVVRDVKHYGLARAMIPGLYYPTTRIDSASTFDSFAYAVHTRGEPAALIQPIRAAVRSLDPELPVVDLKTGPQAIERALASAKTVALVLAAFAAIALALAIGGIYAVLSYVVGNRRHEIGIRMALGAQRAQVLRLVVRQGMGLVAIGVIIGVPVALAGARLLSSLLVGVSPGDPVTYAAVVLVLGATATIAAWIPARRAAGVDPRSALNDGR
jgi:predicted permease